MDQMLAKPKEKCSLLRLRGIHGPKSGARSGDRKKRVIRDDAAWEKGDDGAPRMRVAIRAQIRCEGRKNRETVSVPYNMRLDKEWLSGERKNGTDSMEISGLRKKEARDEQGVTLFQRMSYQDRR